MARDINLLAIHKSLSSKSPYRRLLAQSGVLTSTDGTSTVRSATDMPDGVYQLVGPYLEPVTGARFEDQPTPPLPDGALGYVVVDRRALARAAAVVSTDESRPSLMGVCLRIRDQHLAVVGTDGLRLALTRRNTLPASIPDRDFLVPARAVRLALRYPADSYEILLGAVTATIKAARLAVTAVLLGDKYPVYEQLIPDSRPNSIILDRAAALTACRMLAHYGEILKSDWSPDGLTWTVRNIEREVAKSTAIPARPGHGGPVDLDDYHLLMPLRPAVERGDDAPAIPEGTVQLNPAYLADALAAFDGPELSMGYDGPLAPLVFQTRPF